MNKFSLLLILLLAGMFWFTTFSTPLFADNTLDIPPEALQKIEQAMPDQPVVQPRQPRKLLVFNLSKGYQHASIPYAARALEIMGQKTGAFTVEFSSDLSVFTRRKLRQYDAICFNNTTHLDITKGSRRKSLLRFVQNGGGLIGIHAASDNFYTWPEASKMLGGRFDEHPWTADGTWAVKIDDPNSPLTAMFDPRGFKVNDEIYRIQFLYDQSPGESPPEAGREALHFLLTLDMNDDSTRSADGVRPSDTDLPVSWVRRYGSGRVFYSNFGHNPHLFWNPAILKHYLAGIQFALGDLEVDTTPSLDILLQEIASYDYGQSRQPLVTFNDFLRSLPDSSLVGMRVEARLLDLLPTDAPFAAKQFICEKLGVVGTERSVAPLTKLLADDQTADIARYALERIPGPAVDEVLRQSLASATGKVRIGIINTIGRRGDQSAVPRLVAFLQESDPTLVNAAAAALGHIADQEAREGLYRALGTVSGEAHRGVVNAYLECAGKARKQGEAAEAEEMFRDVYEMDEPLQVRVAALTGMIRSAGEGADQIVLRELRSGEPELQSAVIRLVATLPALRNIGTIAGTLDGLPERQQVQLLTAFGERGDPAARPVVMQAAASDTQPVRIAALKALATVGDASAVEPLARAIAQGQGEESAVARESLSLLPGTDVNTTIVREISTADQAVKEALIQSLKERQIPNITQIVLQAAQDPAQNVRLAAIDVLQNTAQPEVLPAVVDLLTQAASDVERTRLQNAVVAITNQIPDQDTRAEVVLEKLNNTRSPQARIPLLEVLAAIGDSHALPVLRSALRSSNADIKRAATRALSSWPDATPAPDLLRQAQNAPSFNERVLALRGYITLAGVKGKQAPDEAVDMYRRAMQMVARVDEQHLILSGLGHLSSLSALQMATEYLNDSALSAEAGAAAVAIAKSLQAQYPGELSTYLDKIDESRAPEDIKKQAQQLARGLQQN